MATTAQKLKLMYLAKLLESETDDEHGLTGPQIIQRLAELGIAVERKTLYRDLDCLREFGYNIVKYQRSPIEYGLASREFQESELLLLADAVQSSRFLTERKSNALVKAIGKLGSKYLADDLRRNLHVEGRIRSQNESVFYNIDAIQRAISAKKKVRFRYFKYDNRKKRALQRDGRFYEETPLHLVYMDDCYYLVAWNDKHESTTNYRVDRMLNIDVSEEDATSNEQTAEFDAAKYQKRVFGMYSGEAVAVTLLVKPDAISTVIDRFGDAADAEAVEDGLDARAHQGYAGAYILWLVGDSGNQRDNRAATILERGVPNVPPRDYRAVLSTYDIHCGSSHFQESMNSFTRSDIWEVRPVMHLRAFT